MAQDDATLWLLVQMDVASAACECGAEEQTVDHVVLQCPIHDLLTA